MTKPSREASADLWLSAAYDLLIEGGVDAVKVMTLAKRTGLTRTGFYWHFKDLNALLDALVKRWEEKNTGNLVARAAAPAQGVTDAMLNVFDCWHDAALFDAPLDLAIRNWARLDIAVRERLDQADQRRIEALIDLFSRFGYPPEQAEVRSLTVIYTQIGYIATQLRETPEKRLARVPQYVRIFTGVAPGAAEMAAFTARNR